MGVFKSGLPQHRLGLSVSARRVKKAWLRTRIRRLIKESFRSVRGEIKDGPYDIVLTLRHCPKTRPDFSCIDKEVKHILSKAGLL